MSHWSVCNNAWLELHHFNPCYLQNLRAWGVFLIGWMQKLSCLSMSCIVLLSVLHSCRPVRFYMLFCLLCLTLELSVVATIVSKESV